MELNETHYIECSKGLNVVGEANFGRNQLSIDANLS